MIGRHAASVEGACADRCESVPIRDSDCGSRAVEAVRTIPQLPEEPTAPAIRAPASCNATRVKAVACANRHKADSGGRKDGHGTGTACRRNAQLPEVVGAPAVDRCT